MDSPQSDHGRSISLGILAALAILAGLVFSRIGAVWIVVLVCCLGGSFILRGLLAGIAAILAARNATALAQPRKRERIVNPGVERLQVIRGQDGARKQKIL